MTTKPEKEKEIFSIDTTVVESSHMPETCEFHLKLINVKKYKIITNVNIWITTSHNTYYNM